MSRLLSMAVKGGGSEEAPEPDGSGASCSSDPAPLPSGWRSIGLLIRSYYGIG